MSDKPSLDQRLVFAADLLAIGAPKTGSDDLNGGKLMLVDNINPTLFESDLREAAKAVQENVLLTAVVEMIVEIQDEQTSDSIFGGQRTFEQREASRTYAHRIAQAGDKLTDALADLKAFQAGEA